MTEPRRKRKDGDTAMSAILLAVVSDFEPKEGYPKQARLLLNVRAYVLFFATGVYVGGVAVGA